MAQSDSTMVFRLEGKVVATASLNEDLEWSIDASAPQSVLNNQEKELQQFTDEEVENLSPSNGAPQAVLLQRAAEVFGWEVEKIGGLSQKLRRTY